VSAREAQGLKPRPAGRRFLGDKRGSAALEFAMLGPVFLVAIIGLFQVCWAMYCSSSVRYALHNSARALVLTPSMTQTDFETLVKSAVSPLVAANVTVTLTKSSPSSGVQLSTATATYNYQIVIPFIPTYNGAFSTSFVQSGTSY
jgi:Flp pilus assembly protein TadG